MKLWLEKNTLKFKKSVLTMGSTIVRWIYVGKKWNEDLVVKKIEEFQWKLMESN